MTKKVIVTEALNEDTPWDINEVKKLEMFDWTSTRVCVSSGPPVGCITATQIISLWKLHFCLFVYSRRL